MLKGPTPYPTKLEVSQSKEEVFTRTGQKGGEREDMVLENDTAFGLLLDKLRQTDDPRSPGQKLIDNTLVIFTSDNGPNVGNNLGPTPENGGLRGKAKIWEGGLRVPFIASLPGKLLQAQSTRIRSP